jgi:hypothetical protein
MFRLTPRGKRSAISARPVNISLWVYLPRDIPHSFRVEGLTAARLLQWTAPDMNVRAMQQRRVNRAEAVNDVGSPIDGALLCSPVGLPPGGLN